MNVLLRIAPQSVATFVTEAWSGRVSDKYLRERNKILDKLMPGDINLAD